MALRRDCMGLLFVCHCLFIVVTLFTRCDGRVAKYQVRPSQPLSISRGSIIKGPNKLKQLENLQMAPLPDSSNTQPYVSSPFSLPPFEALAPIPLPQDTPPYCGSPPITQQPPSTTLPTPTIYSTPPPETPYYSPPILPIQNPPPGPTTSFPSPPESSPVPYPPEYGPSPPSYSPGTPEYVPSPGNMPSPPSYVPSPPETQPGTPIYNPSPSGYTPPSPPLFGGAPPVFLPPVVYPPPSVPPPPHKSPSFARWCVAKASVPDPIVQEAMNYACGSGADCGMIQQNGACFKPNTLYAHASYAFNSYWQRTKVAGGTCDFGGTAVLVTMDPSYDGCQFVYY